MIRGIRSWTVCTPILGRSRASPCKCRTWPRDWWTASDGMASAVVVRFRANERCVAVKLCPTKIKFDKWTAVSRKWGRVDQEQTTPADMQWRRPLTVTWGSAPCRKESCSDRDYQRPCPKRDLAWTEWRQSSLWWQWRICNLRKSFETATTRR